jgi:hypothetical protein
MLLSVTCHSCFLSFSFKDWDQLLEYSVFERRLLRVHHHQVLNSSAVVWFGQVVQYKLVFENLELVIRHIEML